MCQWRSSSALSALAPVEVSGHLHASQPIYGRQNSPWCPLNKGLCGPQSQSGLRGGEKNSCPCLERNPHSSGMQYIGYALYLLSYLSSNKAVDPHKSTLSNHKRAGTSRAVCRQRQHLSCRYNLSAAEVRRPELETNTVIYY